MCNSGYKLSQIRDIIESGLKGVKRKEKTRENREMRYRSGEDTLEERERKKLLESTSWYRDKINNNSDEAGDRDSLKFKTTRGAWKAYNKKSQKYSKVNTVEVCILD